MSNFENVYSRSHYWVRLKRTSTALGLVATREASPTHQRQRSLAATRSRGKSEEVTVVGGQTTFLTSHWPVQHCLTTNAYTRFPYTHAKALSNTALKLTGLIQNVLAPIIVKVDGIANMAADALESLYPYPFSAKSEQVAALAPKVKRIWTRRLTKKSELRLSISPNINTSALALSKTLGDNFYVY